MIVLRLAARSIVLFTSGLALVIMVVYAYPLPFFAHAVNTRDMSLSADRPLDRAETVRVLSEVAKRLAASPLGAIRGRVSFYAAHSDWRQRLFFFSVPEAGGVVYPVLSHQNAFLIEIDEGDDRIIKDGYRLDPPRTLSYYMTHEAAHLRTAQIVGTSAYYQVPFWVREGVAEYVALGPMDIADRNAVFDHAARGRLPYDLILQHGAYPIARAQVSAALEREGCDFGALLAIRNDTEGNPCL